VSRVAQVLAGNVRAAARLMRDLDDGVSDAREDLRQLHTHTGNAFIVGVTGAPGSGKSTLVDALIAHYRGCGMRVGCLAVDPTSPFTGGAILGDRVRMTRHALDDGVFIRSVATRGALGGVSRSTADMVHVLDAMGMDIILVETVGVGQAEVDIIRLAHTTAVVLVPGLGDDVQAIKAGVMEIADVFVVNKSDVPAAKRVVKSLTMLRNLEGARSDGWVPPVVETIATEGGGVPALAAAVASHRAHLDAGAGVARTRNRARLEVEAAARVLLDERIAADHDVDSVIDRVVRRELDPYAAAELILGSGD
jgi:LAO/AO transport system kinase